MHTIRGSEPVYTMQKACCIGSHCSRATLQQRISVFRPPQTGRCMQHFQHGAWVRRFSGVEAVSVEAAVALRVVRLCKHSKLEGRRQLRRLWTRQTRLQRCCVVRAAPPSWQEQMNTAAELAVDRHVRSGNVVGIGSGPMVS